MFQDQVPFTSNLHLGQRVHCSLYGGKDGTIVAIEGQQAPATVRSIQQGCGVMGGSAYCEIIWDDGSISQRMPEALIRASVQWSVYPEVASPSAISAAHAKAASFKAQAQVEAEARAKAYVVAKHNAIALNPHLKQLSEGTRGDGKFAAKNLRADLKLHWPKCKFSVRSEYNSLSVSWTDGPTSKQVGALVERYKNGHFDGMEDISRYEPTAFTDTFGGVMYCNTSREVSDQVALAAYRALREAFPGNFAGVDEIPLERIRGWQSPAIHGLGITVGEAIRTITSCWDDTVCQFDEMTRSVSCSWLVWNHDGDVKLALLRSAGLPESVPAEPN